MKLSAVALLSGLLLGQSPATQYVRTKTNDNAHCLHWAVNAGPRRSLGFVQSATGDPTLGSGVFGAVSRSAQTWESQMQVCGSVDLVEASPHSASRTVGYAQGGANENLVLFRSQLCSAIVSPGDSCVAAGTCGNVHDCWDHDQSIVALTTTSYIVSTGELVDADVEVNAASATPTIVDSPVCTQGAISTSCVANDVQNAMTHEFGHFLGLAHSPDPASTMYASEPLGELSKRVLDSGSKQFICDVYPSGQASKDCISTPSSTTPSTGCSSAGPIPWAPGVLLVLLTLARRRPAGTQRREA